MKPISLSHANIVRAGSWDKGFGEDYAMPDKTIEAQFKVVPYL
jgi:hypothetical protein